MRPDLDAAVEALEAGGLVVYPTDTLYGLGARARNAAAVESLLAAKGRPDGMPISVAVSSLGEVEALADLTPTATAILRQSLPGPFTFILRASPAGRRLAQPILSPRGNLGIRVPDHPVARELARRAGPIVCTSANHHGHPPARTVAAARKEFGDTVRAYVTAGPRPEGTPSTLVDLTAGTPRTVRRG